MTEDTPNPQPTNESAPQSQPKKDDWLRFSSETIRTVLVVVILAYVLRFFVFEPFIVEGRSMEPRFETNDYLLVDKVSYHFSSPQRGDIIVFKYPNDVTVDYVKRIIGLPGDTVTIEDGAVKIANSAHPNGYVLDESAYLNSDVKTTLPTASRSVFTVPPGYYFVLGDNRPASSDSREWGLLPQADIIGRVILQAFPLQHAAIISRTGYSNAN